MTPYFLTTILKKKILEYQSLPLYRKNILFDKNIQVNQQTLVNRQPQAIRFQQFTRQSGIRAKHTQSQGSQQFTRQSGTRAKYTHSYGCQLSRIWCDPLFEFYVLTRNLTVNLYYGQNTCYKISYLVPSIPFLF